MTDPRPSRTPTPRAREATDGQAPAPVPRPAAPSGILPQTYPLFATLPAGPHVWAVVGWADPPPGGGPRPAFLVALGVGPHAGEQRTAVPDMLWATAEAALRHLRPAPG
jgi:hypothetical protein